MNSKILIDVGRVRATPTILCMCECAVILLQPKQKHFVWVMNVYYLELKLFHSLFIYVLCVCMWWKRRLCFELSIELQIKTNADERKKNSVLRNKLTLADQYKFHSLRAKNNDIRSSVDLTIATHTIRNGSVPLFSDDKWWCECKHWHNTHTLLYKLRCSSRFAFSLRFSLFRAGEHPFFVVVVVFFG